MVAGNVITSRAAAAAAAAAAPLMAQALAGTATGTCSAVDQLTHLVLSDVIVSDVIDRIVHDNQMCRRGGGAVDTNVRVTFVL
jgi:hypothetical protein